MNDVIYQTTTGNFVYRYRDGTRTTIPLHGVPGEPYTNPDYLEYMEWLQAGGVPIGPDDEAPPWTNPSARPSA